MSMSFSVLGAEPVALLVEKGVFQQEVKKDYVKAVSLYSEALEEAEPDGYMNELLFRMAQCSAKMGDEETGNEILEGLVEAANPNDSWVEKAKGLLSVNKMVELVEPEDEVLKVRDIILKATEDNDLELFESVSNENMSEHMTEKVLTSVSRYVSPSLKSGYVTAIKTVKEDELFRTYRWQVVCEDGVKFSLKLVLDPQGMVAGAWIR